MPYEKVLVPLDPDEAFALITRLDRRRWMTVAPPA